MSTPTPVPPNAVPGPAIPWYQSPVQKAQIIAAIAALVALFPRLGTLLGWTTPEAVRTGMEAFFGFAALAAPVIGTILRARSKLQPLTLTQGNADVHPATIAAERAERVAATVTPVFPVTSGVPHAPPPPAPRPVPVSFSPPKP